MTGERPEGTFADRLNLLFETVHPPGRGPWTNKEVASAIRERGGSISDVYIWRLRTSRQDNPSRQCLQDLADFFEIDPAFFVDDRQAGEVLRDLHALRAMRRLGVRKVAARLGEVAGDDPEALGEILDHVVRAYEARAGGTADGESGRPPRP